MRIVVAPNAFKGSLSASDATEAIVRGFEQSPLDCECVCHPVADGGDGTATLLNRQMGGRLVESDAVDPVGRPLRVRFGIVEERLAVMDIAEASGLHLVGPREQDPLVATTLGSGMMMMHALNTGVRAFVLGVGGSATVDAGIGLLRALGVRFLDRNGASLPPFPAAMSRLATIDMSELDPRLDGCAVRVLCDVENPLLGDNGAAAVFGPQKGASAEGVARLEVGLQQFAAVVHTQTGIAIGGLPRGGAAGGLAAGLHALLGAELVSGAEQFLTLTGFEEELVGADLVVTGEGAIDEQTLSGKAPYCVAQRAKARGVPVVAIAGRIPCRPPDALKSAFDLLFAIGEGPTSLADAMKNTALDLERTAYAMGSLVAIARKSSCA